MSLLPVREKPLLRPKPKDQNRLGAARQPAALGSGPRAPAKRTGYLFINKSTASESLSTSKTSRTKTTINAHVQRFRLHNYGPLPEIGDGSSLSAGETSVSDPSSLQQQPEAEADEGQASIRETTSLDLLSSRSDLYGGRRGSDLPLFSNNFIEGDAFDPFGGTAVPIDISTHNVLQFFLHLGWKAHLRNIGRADQLLWCDSFSEVSNVVRGCLFNQMHMFAFLTFIPMRMACYGLSSTIPKVSPEISMSRALRTMREYFAQLSAAPMDDHVILDIFFVAISEFFRQNFVAMRTHLLMIRHIVNSLGGFKNVSRYVREVCCYTELCFALRTGEMPVFEMMWDPGPVQCYRALQDKSASWPARIKACGNGFKSAMREGFFDGITTTIIEELVNDIPALEYVRSNAEIVPADSQWVCIRSRAILHRLMSLETPTRQAPLQERKVHCVISTLIKLMGYENLCITPIRYPEAVRRRLIDSLECSNSDFSQEGNWGKHNDMLLWIMITGVRIARASDDEGWFMSRAVQGCRILGLESYDDLHGLVRKFIWVENRQCPALMKLAGHILIAQAEELDSERRRAALADPGNLGDHMCLHRHTVD